MMNSGQQSNKRDDAARNRACELYLEGKSVKEVGAIMGKHHTLICKWVLQAGIEIRASKGKSEAAAMRAIIEHRRKCFSVGDEATHWANHPEVKKWAVLRHYYSNREAGREKSRQSAKANYHKRKSDPEFKAKKRAALSAWISRNGERYKAVKRLSFKAWRMRPENKIAMAQRRRFKEIMEQKNQLRTVDMIGCSVAFLKDWIASKFKRGMTWGNYGTDWHIDHKLPCVSFNLSDKEQVKACFHYTNLQPLWAAENIAKGDRIDAHQPELCMPI